jgi:hypothetical protein
MPKQYAHKKSAFLFAYLYSQCDRQTSELQRRREKLVALRESLTDNGGKSSKAKKKAGISEHESAASAAASASLEDVTQQLDAAGTARVSASVLRQLVINHLNALVQQSSEDETALYARQYDLTTWLTQAVEHEQALGKRREAEHKGKDAGIHSSSEVSPSFQRDLEACQLNWDPPSKNTGVRSVSVNGSPTGSDAKTLLISRDVAVNMSRQLAFDRPNSVLKWASRVLESLTARCNDPAPTCRAAAVAAIADMVRIDSLVLKVSIDYIH